jgi:hypothetical protein
MKAEVAVALAHEYEKIPQVVIDDLIAHAMSLREPMERAGAWSMVGLIYSRKSKPRRDARKEKS